MAGLTAEQIEQAIRAKHGNITRAAEGLGVSRVAIYKRVKANKRLQAVLVEARESLADLAEDKLRELIEQGNVTAIIFALKTVGKERGYVERYQTEHTGAGGGAIEHRLIIERVEARHD